MAVSRASRKPGRVVRFIDTSQHPQRVDADDSEAAAVLSTLVFECKDKNAMMPSKDPNTIRSTQRPHRRRRSRSLILFGSENFTAPTPSSSIATNPIPKQVNFPSRLHASQVWVLLKFKFCWPGGISHRSRPLGAFPTLAACAHMRTRGSPRV
jgi:hypothetical protein